MKRAYFDIESTGLNTEQDRIIDLAIITTDGPRKSGHTFRFDPETPIPAEVTAIHGITDMDVKGCEKFRDHAAEIMALLEGSTLCGFNITGFDLAILNAEFERAGLEWKWLDDAPIIDAGVIFKRKEERTLTAAVKFYTGREHQKAHNAIADVEATIGVISGQKALYKFTDEELHEWSFYGGKRADIAGKLAYNDDGVLVFNFGKNRGTPCEDSLSLLYWMLDRDFPRQTKRFIMRFLESIEPPIEPELL